NCPAGQVVFLNAGTYNLSNSININNKSNITLRGAGPDKTFVIFNGGSGCTGLGADVCITNGDNNWGGDPHNSATWTGSTGGTGVYAKGSPSITLGAVTLGSIA